jgi:hypothetical protein
MGGETKAKGGRSAEGYAGYGLRNAAGDDLGAAALASACPWSHAQRIVAAAMALQAYERALCSRPLRLHTRVSSALKAQRSSGVLRGTLGYSGVLRGTLGYSGVLWC